MRGAEEVHCATHWHPVGSWPVSRAVGPGWRESGIAEGGDLELTPDLLGVSDVGLVVMVLFSPWSAFGQALGETRNRTPCVEENGILNLLSGPTISSISVVEFSRNVSGAHESGEHVC